MFLKATIQMFLKATIQNRFIQIKPHWIMNFILSKYAQECTKNELLITPIELTLFMIFLGIPFRDKII